MDTLSFNDYREFLKDNIRLKTDFRLTDQNQGISPPSLEKPYRSDQLRIDLPDPDKLDEISGIDLLTAVNNRASRRTFQSLPLRLDEISFLLWVTQGIRRLIHAGAALRTVPSAGCRHAFETYLAVLNIEGLKPGIYRYLPVEHQLLFEFEEKNLKNKLVDAFLGQSFVAKSAVIFLWTAIPYRMEWRYGSASHKVIALDAGHVCQNLYLACEAIEAGMCAIAAYHQELMDLLLRVDGEDEFAVYMAALGKKSVTSQ